VNAISMDFMAYLQKKLVFLFVKHLKPFNFHLWAKEIKHFSLLITKFPESQLSNNTYFGTRTKKMIKKKQQLSLH